MSELGLLDARTNPSQSEIPHGGSAPFPADQIDPVKLLGQVREFRFDEFIFRTGDPKTHVYRLESGIVFLCPDAHVSPIGILCPGDYLGLGFLKKHIHSARVVLRSRVRAIPLERLPELIACDPNIKGHLDTATEREFNAHREASVRTSPVNALSRVAGFLVAISHLNAREGRDPYVFDDTLPCGAVAEWLSMDIDALASHLVELRRRGLINQREPSGLYLTNVAGLEVVYLENSRPLSA